MMPPPNRYIAFVLTAALFLLFTPDRAFSSVRGRPPQGPAPEKPLVVMVRKDTSLDALIQRSGFRLEDPEIADFLREFSSLNEGVKGLSSIKKGTVVKLPLTHLKKAGGPSARPGKTLRPAVRKKQTVRKAAVKKEAGTGVSAGDALVENIRLLLEALSGGAFLETGGMKFFAVSERSEVSFDSSFFPVIVMRNGNMLVLDHAGVLPEEIKKIIGGLWPEYKFVSCRGSCDLRTITGEVLVSLGYSVSRDKTVTAGGRTRIEYHADYLVFEQGRDLLDSDIMMISIIGPGESKTPEELVIWLKERGLSLIQLSYRQAGAEIGKDAEMYSLGPYGDTREFAETALSLMGFAFSRDRLMEISGSKEYQYRLRADLSVDLGYRTKVIEFAELSTHEISYARKRGIDISCVKTWEEKKDILRRIMDLLAVSYQESPQTVSRYITPQKAKYRLLAPGIFVNSMKGPLFLTDSELPSELLRSAVDPKIRVVKF